ncbi:MAG: methylated-DNA--[protein]-cysteine S-methyltransferase [Chloroflexota bacterium]
MLSIGHTQKTILGEIWVAVSENGLASISFPASEMDFCEKLQKKYTGLITLDQKKIEHAAVEIEEYILGQRKKFSLEIDWTFMGIFQQKVLSSTIDIPFGMIRTYKDIANAIGHPGAARAVGRAEADNPIPIVIPCHRVLGADGKLHGYSAGNGLETKKWLLALEGLIIP